MVRKALIDGAELANGKQHLFYYLKYLLWPYNLMLGTTGSPKQFENFMKNILIYVKYLQKSLKAYESVKKSGKSIFGF